MRSFFFFFFSSPFPSLRGALARFCATDFSCRGQAPTEPHASTRHRCLPFEHLICPVFDSGNLFSSSLPPPPSPGIATTGCVEDDARSKRGTLSRLLLLRILAVSALCTIGMLISLFVTTTACHRRRATSVASVAFLLQPVSDVRCELSTIPPCSSTRIEETTEVGSRLSATRPPRETRGPSQAPSFEALFSTSPRFSRLSTSPQAWPRSPPPFPGVGRRTPPAES